MWAVQFDRKMKKCKEFLWFLEIIWPPIWICSQLSTFTLSFLRNYEYTSRETDSIIFVAICWIVFILSLVYICENILFLMTILIYYAKYTEQFRARGETMFTVWWVQREAWEIRFPRNFFNIAINSGSIRHKNHPRKSGFSILFF